jgi:amidase
MRTISADQRTLSYDRKDRPVATVSDGEVFEVECTSLSEGYTHETIGELVLPPPSVPITGPIRIEGALPGDTLKVQILRLELTRDFGCIVLLKNRGAFADGVVESVVKAVRLNSRSATFNEKISLPVRPMLGKIGVAPSGEGLPSNLPGPHGGNLDNTHVREGAAAYLPVFVEGAGLAIGDGHALQGDGESALSGIECEIRAQVRTTVIKGLAIELPIVVSGPDTMTVAEGPTLEEAASKALHAMVALLQAEHALTFADAAMLVSVAADVHVCQMVNPLVGVKVIVPSSLLRLP